MLVSLRYSKNTYVAMDKLLLPLRTPPFLPHINNYSSLLPPPTAGGWGVGSRGWFTHPHPSSSHPWNKQSIEFNICYQSNHQIWRKPMILLFCCFLLFPIEALYKQKNLKKLIFGWHLPYRNVTDPQPCLIKSVHFNKADHYFGFYEFFFYIQEGTGGAS